MTRVFVIFFSLGLLACSSAELPNQKKDFSDFIPREEILETRISKEEDFHFKKDNFPQNCDWREFERVVDGDTIIVDDDLRVRLVGIDTPETKHPTKKIQKFGLESSAFAKEFFKDAKKVCLIPDPIGDNVDIYGRTLAYVFLEDGRDLTVELLNLGLARGYFNFSFFRKEEFQFLEKIAKERKLNIWE
jgi:micrococcal nuclease